MHMTLHLSLPFGCDLSLYVAIAAYKITVNSLPKFNEKFQFTLLVSSQFSIFIH